MFCLVPAANGADFIVPSCHLDRKYLGTVMQWQNPVDTEPES